MKDAVIRVDAKDHEGIKAMKRQYGVNIDRVVSALLHAWQYLTPEQKLAAFQRKKLPERSREAIPA